MVAIIIFIISKESEDYVYLISLRLRNVPLIPPLLVVNIQ